MEFDFKNEWLGVFKVASMSEALVMIKIFLPAGTVPLFEPIFPGSPFSYVRGKCPGGEFGNWDYFLVELEDDSNVD